jgi:hypothetical protein
MTAVNIQAGVRRAYPDATGSDEKGVTASRNGAKEDVLLLGAEFSHALG